MAAQTAQDSLVKAMMEPGFYPKPPRQVTHKETHISHVFFADDLVYKVKKAVRFSFLDYSTLSQRRFFLNEELRLNRRLAPSVYLDVMPICREDSHWRPGGSAEPAEYTLIMRRLPERRMLAYLLKTQQATPEMMRQLAEVLASFHGRAERAWVEAGQEYLRSVEKAWNENFADLQPFVGAWIDSETLTAINQFGLRFFERYRDLLVERAERGWVRDVHGDLHCEHVCFAPEGIQVFDCIEFSAHLRRCDLASEIAFLLMDLEFRGGESLTEPLLARYRELIGDPGLLELLPFFACYRAMVRAKVHALRAQMEEAARYFYFAARYTWQEWKPFLIMVCGLTGSGKSTLAHALGRRLNMRVISSDVVRKALAGEPARAQVDYEKGIYSPAMTETVYSELAHQAESSLNARTGAILDATFLKKAQREKISRIAAQYDTPLFIIRCRAAESVTQKRLTQRSAEGQDISDGRWEIYVEQKAAMQAWDENSGDRRLDLDTEPSVEESVRRVEKFLRGNLKTPGHRSRTDS